MDDTEVHPRHRALSANLATLLGRAGDRVGRRREYPGRGPPAGPRRRRRGHPGWARQQTWGRGRVDRRWSSPPGAGLWFSVILRHGWRRTTVAFLTIAAGVAVAEALNRVVAGAVRLKWPNDLFVGRPAGGHPGRSRDDRVRRRLLWSWASVSTLHRAPGGFDPTIVPPPAVLTGAAARPRSGRRRRWRRSCSSSRRGTTSSSRNGPAAPRGLAGAQLDRGPRRRGPARRRIRAGAGGRPGAGRKPGPETPDGGRLSVASGEVISPAVTPARVWLGDDHLADHCGVQRALVAEGAGLGEGEGRAVALVLAPGVKAGVIERDGVGVRRPRRSR